MLVGAVSNRDCCITPATVPVDKSVNGMMVAKLKKMYIFFFNSGVSRAGWNMRSTQHHEIYEISKAIDGVVGHHDSFGTLWQIYNWIQIDMVGSKV